jgi:alpha-D-ribose 1-methylphosphonate 5-triphosphate diphosphatase
MTPLLLTGGQVLSEDGLVSRDLLLADEVIADGTDRAAPRLDARGLFVLPGIIDIHGDAHERQVQPRPGVAFSALLALQETERQMLANGITTGFLGITLSWEPGLRGAETWRALLDALAAQSWTCDMRVHLRWEACNLDALDMALENIGAGRVHMVGFNDHTPAILRKLRDPAEAVKYVERSCVDADAFRVAAYGAAERAWEAPAAIAAIAAACRARGVPLASHDDPDVATRDSFRAQGAHICEFPMAEAVAESACAAGDAVVMGCPNVLRGRSHLGWASAARLAEAGICTVLCSDYYHPAMAPAAMALSRGRMGLTGAWALIAHAAANAAGLNDRGRLARGLRADVVLVDRHGAVAATIVQGRLAWIAPHAVGRITPLSI